jgi:hypothetical protein
MNYVEKELSRNVHKELVDMKNTREATELEAKATLLEAEATLLEAEAKLIEYTTKQTDGKYEMLLQNAAQKRLEVARLRLEAVRLLYDVNKKFLCKAKQT